MNQYKKRIRSIVLIIIIASIATLTAIHTIKNYLEGENHISRKIDKKMTQYVEIKESDKLSHELIAQVIEEYKVLCDTGEIETDEGQKWIDIDYPDDEVTDNMQTLINLYYENLKNNYNFDLKNCSLTITVGYDHDINFRLLSNTIIFDIYYQNDGYMLKVYFLTDGTTQYRYGYDNRDGMIMKEKHCDIIWP